MGFAPRGTRGREGRTRPRARRTQFYVYLVAGLTLICMAWMLIGWLVPDRTLAGPGGSYAARLGVQGGPSARFGVGNAKDVRADGGTAGSENPFRPKSAPKSVPASVDVSRMLEMCTQGPLDLDSFLKRHYEDNKCQKPSSLEDFVCDLGCDVSEPELENSFRPFSTAKYSHEHLWKLCQKGRVSALIWVIDNQPHYLVCGGGDHVHSRALFASTNLMLSLLLCSFHVGGPLLFAIDQNDWAAPAFEADVPGWSQPLPGVLRYVGVPSHPSLLLPTRAFVEASTHCNLGSSSLSRRIKTCRFMDGSPKLRNIPWREKEDVIFWRGSSTGLPLKPLISDYLPRPAMMRKLAGLPGFDLGFVGGDPPAFPEYMDFFRAHRKAPVRQREYSLYKHILHCDGHTASWGFAAKLTTRSLILLIGSIFHYREFYYVHVRPWEHYMPVDPDLSNIESIRDWLATKEGGDYARETAKRAGNLFEDRLRPEATYCYLARLLYTLRGQQKFSPAREYLSGLGIPLSKFVTFEEYSNLKEL